DNNLLNGTPYCYKVKARIGDCESEFSDLACKSFMGLEDISQSNLQVKLYPNPSDGKARLEIEGLNTEADVFVYDMIGRVIKKHQISIGENELDIDLSGYAKGIYSIRIVNESINQTKKLIVQ
ncbi:MAG: T9SS type A sorting domain-containing protein, partial [Bacteroidia bacterium]|nr:T9SS type A sorting domain-containing protein [Bacteroidia bacterium]